MIQAYQARVAPAAFGGGVQAFVQLDCYGAKCILKDPSAHDWPEVLEVHRVSGDACTVLKIAVADMAQFQDRIDRLARYGRPTSSLVLSSPLPWKPARPLR